MKPQKSIRVYADSSVFGGVYDEEFLLASRIFFQEVRQGFFSLVISSLIRDELENAPENIRELFQEIRVLAENIEVTEESLILQEKYLRAGIVGPKWESDALHVALATVHQCRMLVSWNFKHIVHYQKINGYNAINLLNGYGALAIHTPQEVISHENEDL